MTYQFRPIGKKGVNSAYTGGVEDRVRRFFPLVKRMAWHNFGSGRPGLEVEDLIQAGLVALTEAAQRHDGPNDDGFAAYAKLRVRGAMIDLFRRNAAMTRGAMERKRQLRETEARLSRDFGRPPTHEELAEQLGITSNALSQLKQGLEPIRFESIDEVYADNDAIFADDAPSPLNELEASELKHALVEAITGLPERLQLVIQLHFVEEMNLTEIAAVLGVSIPRVHQLKAQAVGKLRDAMDDR